MTSNVDFRTWVANSITDQDLGILERIAKWRIESHWKRSSGTAKRGADRPSEISGSASPDPFVVSELTAEAVQRAWLEIPDLATVLDSLDATGDPCSDCERIRQAALSLAIYGACKAVLSRHWIAGPVVDHKRLRSAKLRGADLEKLGLAQWSILADRHYDQFWSQLWFRLSEELSKRQLKVAELMSRGMTNKTDIGRELNMHRTSVIRAVKRIRSISEETARQFAGYRFSEISAAL